MSYDKPFGPVAFYRPELDGLRFLAFLFVFSTHAFLDDASWYLTRGVQWPLAHLAARLVHIGRFGVPLFFVLSSYLITELLIREHARTGSIHVGRFYLRRALRIWPLYIVFVLVAGAILRVTLGASAFGSEYLLGLLLFFGNWAMMLGWGPGAGDLLTEQLWSVSVEEQFYLVWPLLLSLVGVRRVRMMAMMLIGLAVAVRLAMDLIGAAETTVWYSSFTWLDSIGVGALLAAGLNGQVPRFKTLTRLALVAAGPTLWLVAAAAFSLLPIFSLFYPLIIAGAVSLFLGAIGSQAFAHPVLVYLGKRSYGLYVLHLTGRAIAWHFFPPLGPSSAVASFAVTTLLAVISYRWLEKPFLVLKARFSDIESRPA